MKAAICTAYGGPEVIQILEAPKPKVKANHVLVKIHASAVNSGDARVRGLQVSGILRLFMRLVLGITKPRKAILGTVYAGVVEAVGVGVIKYKIGDEVYGLTGFNFGGHAEFIAVNENSVMYYKPKNASFEEAAAIAFGGQTAHYFLHKSRLSATAHMKVLIYGASGSVGSAALQIAQYYQADVTAVCSESSNAFVQQIGVQKIINYEKTNLTSIKEKYDLIFDAHGSIKKGNIQHLLSPNAHFFSVGAMDYAKESIDQLKFLNHLFESGKYQVCIDKSYSLDDIVEAHRYVDTGKKKGNVVLKIIN